MYIVYFSLSFRGIIFCLISWPLGGSCQLEMEVVWSVSDSERIQSRSQCIEEPFFLFFFFFTDLRNNFLYFCCHKNVTDNFGVEECSDVWQIDNCHISSATRGQQSASQRLIFYSRQISSNFTQCFVISGFIMKCFY